MSINQKKNGNKSVNFGLSILLFLLLSTGNKALADLPNELLHEVNFAGQFRPEQGMRIVDGRIVFSQYAPDGNNFDIVSVDPKELTSQVLVQGEPEARFLTKNERWLAYTKRYVAVATPLVVVDRVTNKKAGQIRLHDSIVSAHVFGDRLHLVQQEFGKNNLVGVVMSLPDLKVVSTELIAAWNNGGVSYMTIEWNEDGSLVVLLGPDLRIYEKDFKPRSNISLTMPESHEGRSCPVQMTLQPEMQRAFVLVRSCDILVYDLKQAKLERIIPAYGNGYHLTATGNLLITLPWNADPSNGSVARVYDVSTGKWLAELRLPPVSQLVVIGERIAVTAGNWPKYTLKFYDFNRQQVGVRDDDAIVVGCSRAQEEYLKTTDIYAAIAACENAGIGPLLGGSNLSPRLNTVVRQYGLWLEKTWDRLVDAEEALSNLATDAAYQNDNEVKQALTEMRLKMRVISGAVVGTIADAERRTEFGKALSESIVPLQAQTKMIDHGSLYNIWLSNNFAYVGRYACALSDCEAEDGPNLGILDRQTLTQIASVTLLPYDEEFQDGIEGVADDEKFVYVKVGYRYPESDPHRTNLYVVDKHTWQVIDKKHVDRLQSLLKGDGQILSCKCNILDEQEPGCRVVDVAAAAILQEVPNVCIDGGISDSHRVSSPPPATQTGNFEGISGRYLIEKISSGEHESRYLFHSLRGDDSVSSVRVPFNASFIGDMPSLTQVVWSMGPKFGSLDIGTGATSVLLWLPSMGNDRRPIASQYGRWIFVGLGRDLLVYDTSLKRVVRYFIEFIPGGLERFESRDNGPDTNAIDRLIIDSDRVIAVTFSGRNTRIVPISALNLEKEEINNAAKK